VVDAEEAGWGCSTRNGGQVSTSIKPGFDQLAKRHGKERAFGILREGQQSLAWIAEFVRSEGIECDFGQVGRFHAAHNAAQYEALAAKLANQPKGLEVRAHVVPRAELPSLPPPVLLTYLSFSISRSAYKYSSCLVKTLVKSAIA
jgi:glycine/D-amino acid oxidase-like deaminating enzyme